MVVKHMKKYRELRDNGVSTNKIKYVETLTAYASDKHYFGKIKVIIKMLREDYEIPNLNRIICLQY